MSKAATLALQEDAGRSMSCTRQFQRGEWIAPHSHACAQVLLSVSGIMWVEFGTEAVVVPPTHALWLPWRTVHAIRMMSPVEVQSLYLRELDVRQLPKQPSVLVTSGLLREIIKILTESEVVASEEYRATAIRLVMLLLAKSAPCSNRIPLPDGVDARLDSLCPAVIANPPVEASFREHAASTRASTRTLSRLFSSELGLSFAVWRRRVQLAIAVSWLADGHSVADVACSLGYRPRSFSEMLRRELGVPPSAYSSSDSVSHGTEIE
jgi:AraC-like DNA-binding protein